MENINILLPKPSQYLASPYICLLNLGPNQESHLLCACCEMAVLIFLVARLLALQLFV